MMSGYLSRCAGQQSGASSQVMNMPSTLLRFFDREHYACRFVEGEIRVGLLERYRTIEGSRKDESEGRVSFYWNQKAPELVIDKATGQVVGQRESDQNIHYCGSSVNPHFVLCTSHPDVEIQVLVRRFGQFIVRIDDPTALLERMKPAWKSHAWALDGGALIVPVVYNKDGLLQTDPYLIAPPHLDYSQKPELFKEEREFRYVLTCSIDTTRALQDALTLKLPDCSDICSLN